jgi:hypothetical protein
MTLPSDKWGRNADATWRCSTLGGFHIISKLLNQTTSLIDRPKVSYGSGTHNSRGTAVWSNINHNRLHKIS